jgi:hypothetical protein
MKAGGILALLLTGAPVAWAQDDTVSYDAIAQHLPAETQMYVPRVEAVLQQREGANLEQLSTPQG